MPLANTHMFCMFRKHKEFMAKRRSEFGIMHFAGKNTSSSRFLAKFVVKYTREICQSYRLLRHWHLLPPRAVNRAYQNRPWQHLECSDPNPSNSAVPRDVCLCWSFRQTPKPTSVFDTLVLQQTLGNRRGIFPFLGR